MTWLFVWYEIKLVLIQRIVFFIDDRPVKFCFWSSTNVLKLSTNVVYIKINNNTINIKRNNILIDGFIFYCEFKLKNLLP